VPSSTVPASTVATSSPVPSPLASAAASASTPASAAPADANGLAPGASGPGSAQGGGSPAAGTTGSTPRAADSHGFDTVALVLYIVALVLLVVAGVLFSLTWRARRKGRPVLTQSSAVSWNGAAGSAVVSQGMPRPLSRTSAVSNPLHVT
jgi:cobalamin biosynthesis Mg chelatase CobN